MVSNHLPECLHDDRTYGPSGLCICEELLACEQRVLSLNSVALGVLIAQRARERALDAAREAIKSVCHQHPLIWPTDEGAMQALDAAIDALKEKP